MRIYAGKNKREAKEVDLRELIAKTLRANGFDVNIGEFSDGSSRWLEVKQTSKKPSEVTVSISFKEDYTQINEIEIFEADIITIVDEDHSRKIV